MLQKLIATIIFLISASAQALVLEPVDGFSNSNEYQDWANNRYSNPNDFLTWSEFDSAEEMKKYYDSLSTTKLYIIGNANAKKQADINQKFCEGLGELSYSRCVIMMSPKLPKNYRYTHNKYKLADDIKKREAEDQLKQTDLKRKACQSLNNIASITCLNAIELESKSTSAIEPVKEYMKLIAQSNDEELDKVIALINLAAQKRVSNDYVRSLLVEVCAKDNCN